MYNTKYRAMDLCPEVRDIEEKCKCVCMCVCTCACMCVLKVSGRPAYLQSWLPLFTFLLQCFHPTHLLCPSMWGTPRGSIMEYHLG